VPYAVAVGQHRALFAHGSHRAGSALLHQGERGVTAFLHGVQRLLQQVAQLAQAGLDERHTHFQRCRQRGARGVERKRYSLLLGCGASCA
jgi:hypothetical protein